MASWSYEAEQKRLQRLWDEAESDGIEEEAYDSESSLEEDHVEIQGENSDTEQDISDGETEVIEPDLRRHRETCFISKDGTKWKKHLGKCKNIRTRADNIITQLPGVKAEAKQKTVAAEIWSLFITDGMIENIVTYTNMEIETKQYSETNRTVRPTDKDEIKALLGLLYIAGKMKSNHHNIIDLFRTDGMGFEIFRLTMSLQRFKLLLQNFRLDDKTTRPERQKYDKLAAVRTFFDELNANLPNYFSISQYATVDEMLWAFRGRCGFRVYIPSKPNKYGIKVYSLVDAKMFYTAKMEIYVGQQPTGPYKLDTSNISLVPRLCEPVWGSRRNITMDNFFTSTALANTLLKDHKLTLTGTLRKNKPQIPEELKSKRPDKTSMFAFQETCTMVSYIPRKNKNVFLLSTMHRDDAIDRATGKPDMIIDYNGTKGGVDTVDKLCAAYNCARLTRRWPMVIFYGALNVAGINSYVIYKNNVQTKLPRRVYLENLGNQLLEPHVKKRFYTKNLPKAVSLRIGEIYNISNTANDTPTNSVYGRCYCCSSKKSRKTKYRCFKCQKFMCLEHVTPACKECVEIIH